MLLKFIVFFYQLRLLVVHKSDAGALAVIGGFVDLADQSSPFITAMLRVSWTLESQFLERLEITKRSRNQIHFEF